MAISKATRSSLPKRTKQEVLRRDRHRCRYCGATARRGRTLEIDHVIPVHLGGTNARWNLTAACHDCNTGKADTMPTAEIIAAVRQDESWYRYSVDQVTMPCSTCFRPVDTSGWDGCGLVECGECSRLGMSDGR